VISVHVDRSTFDRVKASLASVQAAFVPTVIKTARRAVWIHVVPNVVKRVANESGIGGAIWGGTSHYDGSTRTEGMTDQGLVAQGRLLITEDGGVTSLVLRGIPALLEGGGTIAPHAIKRPFGNLDPRGRELEKKRAPMQHPGMQLRAHRFGRDELKRADAAIQADVATAVTEMLRRHGA
jgi:hypothetical protein